jgi:IMP cyclohydrolase
VSCIKGLVEFRRVNSRGLKLEEVTRIGSNPRICRTCVRILEELLSVSNCSVSTF